MAKRVWRRLTPEVRREVIRLAALGWAQVDIARAVCRSHGSVQNVLRSVGGLVRSERLGQPAGRLSIDDRAQIHAGLQAAATFTAIAAVIGVSVSTVSREVNDHGGRDGYLPMVAHRDAVEARRRPKACKLSRERLRDRVVEDLEGLFSPEQISCRLRAEFPDDSEMWVSHETIYKTLYVQGRGELRRELTACLRTGRAMRRVRVPGGRENTRIKNMVMISERPAEVLDRAVPGDWEGDLIIGKDKSSAIGTLVERRSRFVLLLHLPGRRDALSVREEMTRVMMTLPAELRRSITWDQGIEMAQHATFTITTGIPVYFCDPHSPWQRGSNENTNGLLRQFFRKGTDLSVHTRADLDRVQFLMNRRPRKTLNWKTPAEHLNDYLALTA
jgi:IS30 family transposase